MSIWAGISHILPPAKYWDISQRLGVSGSWSIHANSSVFYCLSTISIPDDGIVFEKCFVLQDPFLRVCCLVGVGGLKLLLSELSVEPQPRAIWVARVAHARGALFPGSGLGWDSCWQSLCPKRSALSG